MKGIKIQGDRSLVWSELPEPVLRPSDVLIEIRCAGVNRADLLQRAGAYSPPAGVTDILGLEFSGVVLGVGAEVTSWKNGQRVFGLISGGAYAEQVTLPASHLMEIPTGMTFEEAASLPEAYFTALLNLILEGNLKSGQCALVHAAASGVGLASIQVIKLYGADPYGTAGTAEKCKKAEEAGALHCLNYKQTDLLEFESIIREEPFHFILNLVGSSTLKQDLTLAREGGRICFLSLLSGRKGELDLAKLVTKRLILRGSTLRNRSEAEKLAIRDRFCNELLPQFASGNLRPLLDNVFPIQDVEAAHRYLEENRNAGKVVLRISE